MHYSICSRSDAEAWNPLGNPHCIISISTPGMEPAKAKANEHTLGVLALQFHDLDREPGPVFREIYGKPILFGNTIADRILQFYETWVKQIAAIRVHCDAGQSRSPAVAAALARIEGDKQQASQIFRQYTPNALVYSTLIRRYFDQ